MGLFDEVYNIIPSPCTGIVYSTLQTKSLERMQMRYNFYQKVERITEPYVAAYTMDNIGKYFFDKCFFTVYYKIKGSIITPEVEKVIVEDFNRLAFFEVQKRDILVYVDGKVLRGLPLSNYQDIGFILSFLSMKRPVKVLIDSKDVLEVSWRASTIRFEKVNYIPFICRTCGNVKNFTIREDLFSDVYLICDEHGRLDGNAIFLKGKYFFGWRFFDSFAPVFLLGDLYGVNVQDGFEIDGIKMSFVELPVYDLDYPVFVEKRVGNEVEYVKIEEYLHL